MVVVVVVVVVLLVIVVLLVVVVGLAVVDPLEPVPAQQRVKSKNSNPQGDSMDLSRKFLTCLVMPKVLMALRTLEH